MNTWPSTSGTETAASPRCRNQDQIATPGSQINTPVTASSGHETVRVMKLIFSAALNFPCSGKAQRRDTAAGTISSSQRTSAPHQLQQRRALSRYTCASRR
ncbi:MAG: hypothetical protein KBD01_18450 [Acidobacteria bacterium]|nr:hypothetical protein [Acidobacteriota bacterium]